ncbi:MAG: hypothetical protein AB1351_03335 [Thermoproteota archaeon]
MRKETQKMHIASQQPNFVIEPVLFNDKGGFDAINLVNHGQTATDISAHCICLDRGKKIVFEDTFFIVSLAKDSRAILELPVENMLKEHFHLRVELQFRNITGNSDTKNIGYDFNREIRKIAYQYSYEGSTNRVLKNIRDTMSGLRNTKKDYQDKQI